MSAPEAAGTADATRRDVRPVLVLVGAPGAGKTTVGRLLADRLGVGLRDTDADVEAAVGSSVADIFVELGEERFRAEERAAVAAALVEHPGVLALGGGAIADPDTRAELAGHTVVHLDVGVSDAAHRVGMARDRPLLVEAPRARLAALLRERRPLYAAVATIVIDTAGRSPRDVAEAVLDALGTPPAEPAGPAGETVRSSARTRGPDHQDDDGARGQDSRAAPGQDAQA
jgi:shikimate kinase